MHLSKSEEKYRKKFICEERYNKEEQRIFDEAKLKEGFSYKEIYVNVHNGICFYTFMAIIAEYRMAKAITKAGTSFETFAKGLDCLFETTKPWIEGDDAEEYIVTTSLENYVPETVMETIKESMQQHLELEKERCGPKYRYIACGTEAMRKVGIEAEKLADYMHKFKSLEADASTDNNDYIPMLGPGVTVVRC